MSENYIDAQNKAYLFIAKQYSEEIANKALLSALATISEKEKSLLQEDLMILERAKQFVLSIISNTQLPCFAEENSTKETDYPIGSIISVSVVCSPEDSSMPYMEEGVKVNTLLKNIYINTKDQKQGQAFHWFSGKEITDSNYSLMPGVWVSRGICGGFSNEIVGFKYYLAQRVK
jgi:hypothetical protein